MLTPQTSAEPFFFFDAARLQELAEARRGEFQAAQPFKHLVLDDFLPEEVARAAIAAYPGVDEIEWKYQGPGLTRRQRERRALDKLGQDDETKFPPLLRHLAQQLNSGVFLSFLEELTGFRGLIPDPTFNDCGLHSTGPGGRLMIHTDLDRHPFKDRRLNQVLNLIVYLNPDWDEAWGGHLELRDAKGNVGQRIAPFANRAALFHTGPRSYHGHPEPLACPPDRRRNSLAVYYYMLVDPTQESNLERQVTVRWVPTEAEDFEFQSGVAGQAQALRERLAGNRIELTQAAFPAEVPDAWRDAVLEIDFFERAELPLERRMLCDAAFEGARDQDGETRDDLVAFASVRPQGLALATPLWAALGADGGVLVTIPGREGELLYLGDLVSLLCSIELGSQLGLESPFAENDDAP